MRSVLEDGNYDAMVVDATAGDGSVIHLELAIAAGPHRGHLVTVAASGLERDPLDLLALPATIVVAEGRPQVILEG